MRDYDDPFDYERDDGREHIEGVCSGCGERVTSVTADMGIGAYEYWGAVGVHHDWQEVSPCCTEEVVEEPEEEEVAE